MKSKIALVIAVLGLWGAVMFTPLATANLGGESCPLEGTPLCPKTACCS